MMLFVIVFYTFGIINYVHVKLASQRSLLPVVKKTVGLYFHRIYSQFTGLDDFF